MNPLHESEPNFNISDYLNNLEECIQQSGIEAYLDDGRQRIEKLYRSYAKLVSSRLWAAEIICLSSFSFNGKNLTLPVIGFKTKLEGPATYILSGIHGEEVSGPLALAECIELFISAGEKQPLVLIPLCNPAGYYRGWRYINKEKYDDLPENLVISAGDMEHILLDKRDEKKPRKDAASCLEAQTISDYIVKTINQHQPLISIDFHEDNMIPGAYIYSQGPSGSDDVKAKEYLNILKKNNIPVETDGLTRFGEKIIDGIVGPQHDGSIDEFMATEKIVVNGICENGPGAKSVFVIELPGKETALKKRINACKSLISFILSQV